MNSQRNKFLLENTANYLNCAYMSPQLKVVEKAGIEGIRQKRNPFKVAPEDFFETTEKLRNSFAKIINAAEPERIVVIPSVSYGMANVARNLPISRGEKIVVAGEQFPSNVYPWRSLAKKKGAEIVTVPPPAIPENRGKTWNENILNAIDSNTRMVAIGNVHWADGTWFDLKAIREKTHQHRAWLVIDGTQSVGALPFDVQQIKPDALACAGYKWLMGPYSIGMAYYGTVFDEGNPIEENWINRYESENFSQLVNYNENYQPGALRYEVGEHSNFVLVPMMLAALRQINEWGVENIQEYCREITSGPIDELKEGGFRIEDADYRGSHLFGIRLAEHHDIDKIKQRFAEENIYVSFRGDSIRVAPNVYNEAHEVQKLADILLSTK